MMRLSWVRALPPRLWGGPGAPQVTRGLCQRPARDPNEGITPTQGTPKPAQPPSWGDTAGAETSRGDTLRGDTSRGDTLRGDTLRGDTLRGDTLRGDTLRGDTLRGDTLRGDTLRGDTLRGDTLRGDTLRGDTLRGDISRGDTSRDDASRGDTLRGDTLKGDFLRSDTLKGDTSRGDTLRGDISRGDTLRGDTSRGDTLRGDTSRGDTLRGGLSWDDILRDAASRGDFSRGDTSRGDTSRGGPSWGDILRGATSRGSSSWGDPSKGGPSRGDTSRGDPLKGGPSRGDDPSGGGASKTPSPPSSSSSSSHRGKPPPGSEEEEEDEESPPGSGASHPRRGPAAFAAALAGAGGSRSGRGGGRLALVEAALAAMPALGVERDVGAYNGLLRLLPRGPWVPRGPVQRLLFPFPRQQECGLRLLEQMERYGVMPDAETQFLLLGVFGPRSRPLRKLQRMLYWLPRFRHLDPHPLPPKVPPPGVAAARLGLRRIANDPDAAVTVLQPPVPDSGEDEGSVQPYIVSSQSPEQKELLAQHGPSRPVFVEGPFPLWLRRTRLSYFVLRGDPLPPHLRNPPVDPERSFYFPLELELDLERGPWDDDEFDVDEVEEGPVFALCVAGSGDRRTLGRWISGLQEENPVLGSTPVVFRLSEGSPHDPGPPQGSQPPRLESGTPPAAELEPPEGSPKGTGE